MLNSNQNQHDNIFLPCTDHKISYFLLKNHCNCCSQFCSPGHLESMRTSLSVANQLVSRISKVPTNHGSIGFVCGGNHTTCSLMTRRKSNQPDVGGAITRKCQVWISATCHVQAVSHRHSSLQPLRSVCSRQHL